MEKDYFINDFSKEVWESTYQDSNDKTVEDTWRRNAKCIASCENDSAKYEEMFFDLLKDFKFVPGGRIIANAGTTWGGTTFINCFTADRNKYDIDSLDGILSVLKDQASTLKSEGGWGCNFSFIRPRGSFIHGIGVETPGAVKYMELFDKSSDIITSGSGKKSNNLKAKKKIRKGAMMGILGCWHPDIEEFITAKQSEGVLTKFNISVGCHDDFMEKVQKIDELVKKGEQIPCDLEKWELIFPDTTFEKYKEEWCGDIHDWKSKGYPVIVYKTTTVSYIWNLIMNSTYMRNDPGVLFLDVANKTHCWNYGGKLSKILESNPCQPKWAKVLTKNGIRNFGDISEGDMIWSSEGWTTVVKKWSTGIKKVFAYKTTANVFYGTSNHRLVSNCVRTEAQNCKVIDVLAGDYSSDIQIIPEVVMDGLVLGDGSVHKHSNNLVYLCVGQNDSDYFDSEISKLIVRHRPGVKKYAYEIQTSVCASELPYTFLRKIPDRFLYGDKNVVASFLRGLYSANGSVVSSRITLKATSFDIIEQVQIMLSSLGIRSYYTANKPLKNKFSNGEYDCKKSYDLNVSIDREKFLKMIGFVQKYKQEKLSNIVTSIKPKKVIKNCYDVIEESYVSEEEVFDITVDNESHTYWTQGCNVSNCGEQTMPTASCCNLGSLNLTKFVNISTFEFDYESLKKYVRIAVRFLDNVNSLSKVPLESYKVSMEERRRIGLGIMGWGSALYLLKTRYGSEKASQIKNKLLETIFYTAIDESSELAKEKGMFVGCEPEKHANNYYFDQIELPNDIREKILKYGVRNSSVFSFQPTGNTGIYANNVSGGLEPIFMPEYIRTSIVTSCPEHFKDKCPKYWENKFEETEMFKWTKEGTDDILVGTDQHGVKYKIDKNRGLTKETLCEDYSVNVLKKLGQWDSLAEWVVSTTSLTVDEHIKDMSEWAKFIDAAISKTINLKNSVSYEEFKDIYLKCYKTGFIKGFTTYREGTMMSVLKSAKTDDKPSEQPLSHADVKKVPRTVAPKRPKSLNVDVHHISQSSKRYYVVVGKLGDEVYEVFTGQNSDGEGDPIIPKSVTSGTLVKMARGKYVLKNDDKYWQCHLTNGHTDDNADALTRMISTALRHGANVEFIVHQLEKTKGDLTSFAKVLARVLKKYIKDGTEVHGETCPNCGSTNIVRIEGCKSCKQCGNSACG